MRIFRKSLNYLFGCLLLLPFVVVVVKSINHDINVVDTVSAVFNEMRGNSNLLLFGESIDMFYLADMICSPDNFSSFIFNWVLCIVIMRTILMLLVTIIDMLLGLPNRLLQGFTKGGEGV